tara:strand:+ start:706 stop:951 length:246 start_codon:yes stop_codon:yes gene_type:complete
MKYKTRIYEVAVNVSKKSQVSEGIITNLLFKFFSKKLKNDPDVQSAYNDTIKAASKLEFAIQNWKKNHPNEPLPSIFNKKK